MAVELIKDVGFAEFARIAHTVKQIQRALNRAMEDFPEYKNEIGGMIESYDICMHKSVSEAFRRLHGMLEDSDLPKEIVDTILHFVE